jgi:hypothetical protein
MILLALPVALLLTGCASADRGSSKERCEKDARARYLQCMNPTFIPEGEPMPVPKSEESQSCHIAYQQALSTCDGGAPVPLFPIGTSTSAADETP